MCIKCGKPETAIAQWKERAGLIGRPDSRTYFQLAVASAIGAGNPSSVKEVIDSITHDSNLIKDGLLQFSVEILLALYYDGGVSSFGC